MKQHPSMPTSVIMLVCGLIVGFFLFSREPHGATNANAQEIRSQAQKIDQQAAAEMGLIEVISGVTRFISYDKDGPNGTPVMYLWNVYPNDGGYDTKPDSVKLIGVWDTVNGVAPGRSGVKLEPYK